MAKKVRGKIFDSDGVEVIAGCKVSFSYGIPPVAVTSEVVERNGELIALTPGHNPKECKMRTLEHHVGSFWVRGEKERS